MVVEDDPDLRDALTPILKFEGYKVVGAENGREAMDQLHATAPPSLILLDLMMPVMDGWEFRVEQLRDPALAGIPVILISAHSALRQDARALHVAAHLQKPLDIDGLLEMIRRYC